jgi:alkaline phosphatase
MKYFLRRLCIALTFIITIFQYISCANEIGIPKNVILFISDGCGYNQIDAASLYQYGQTGLQIYEKFPVKYAMSTYSINGSGYDPESAWTDFKYVRRKATDSAAAATAIATGIKTYNGGIGVDTSKIILENIIEKLEKFGKSTGLVTSVQFSQGTPAGFVAHNESRGNYVQISQEMILESNVDVIMGCGHPYFDDDGQPSHDTTYKFVGGKETWLSLLNNNVGSDADNDGFPDHWILIQDRVEFQNMMMGKTPNRLIGIPKVRNTLQQSRSGEEFAEPYVVPFNESIPTLDEMTRAAINVLDKDDDGFFLLVEGGAVDWAGHDNQSGRMIEEEISFNKSVEAVVDWVNKNSNWDETLIIVTGDHETGYLTGPDSNPSLYDSTTAIQEIWKPLVNNGKGRLPGMEWNSHGHTNSLLPIYAKGVGSEKFHLYANRLDPVRGKYIDNTDIGKILFSFY